MKKKTLIFTCADKNNFQYTKLMLNSLTKFHPVSENVDILCITDVDPKTAMSQLPKGVILEDLKPYLKDDPIFFYRQKPVVAEKYMNDYELVLGLDSDQIITGSLDYILNTKDYDVGVVINWNRVDPQMYGFVDIGRLGIVPVNYYNCGLVAMRSKKFVHHWLVNCFLPEFQFVQYKEQDEMNILCSRGNYNVRCFDLADGVAKYYAWHGLVAKGELNRAELRGDDIVIPKGEGETPFPPNDMIVKVVHAGGGNQANKMNYHTWVNADIAARLDKLVSETK